MTNSPHQVFLKVLSVDNGLLEGIFRWEFAKGKNGGRPVGRSDTDKDPAATKLPESSLKLATTNGPHLVSYT